MPAALVKSLSKTTGIDLAEAEKRWKNAKAIAEKETGLNEGDGEDFWRYVTGVFKKSMGKVLEAAGEPDRPRTICVDFDGVIADYSKGWQGPDIFGEPIHGAGVSMSMLKDAGWKIIIFTTRKETPALRKYLQDNAIPWDEINKNTMQPEGTNPGKPIADIYLDDRGFRFKGWADFRYALDAMQKEGILESATAEEVHAAAHEAATSHLNDLPQPSEAQVRAGVYKKGHIWLHGLNISIENPKGSTRSGIDMDGKPWSCVLPAHYGDVRGTLASDGDPCDVYIGDHPESERVFVVDQLDLGTGNFDEHKSIIGTLSQEEARDIYVNGFSDGKGADRIGAITEVSIDDFKAWLKTHKTKKPMSRILESANDYLTAVQSATSIADIEAVFAAMWPGVIRLTDNQANDKVKASISKEGAMTAIELQRNNVTVAEFFSAIKAACKKKGMSFDLDRENFENPHGLSDDTYTVRDGIKYARYGKGEPTREYDGSDAGAKAETYRVKPYDYQCYILNHDGSMWNESCEFTFDDEKRGHGYYYQASKEATDTPNEKTITKDQAHYNFYKQYSELDLGWLEPIRDIIDQYALDNSSDSKPENMAEVAINTAIGYRDQPEYAWELFGKELERVGVKR